MWTGVSGLQVMKSKMEFTANNAANAASVGFKKFNVTLQDASYDLLKSASQGRGNTGGTNPVEIGMGVKLGSVSKIMTQGQSISTGRSLDFMINDSNSQHFFALKNGGNSILLTRNGRFNFDKEGFLVDSLGNKVQGRNVSPETQVESAIGDIKISASGINASATTGVEFEANLPAFEHEKKINENSLAWELFSGGEYFGKMNAAIVSGGGKREIYGSGYYQDSKLIKGSGTLAGAVVTLSAADANLVLTAGDSAFKVGNTVQVSDGTVTLQKQISAIGAAGQITLADAAGLTLGAVTIKNMSNSAGIRGTNAASTSTTATVGLYDDVLRSQVAMVDNQGRLVASFYRVSSSVPKKFTNATVATTAVGNPNIKIGIGEFTSMDDLRGLIEQTLKDKSLSAADPTTDNVQVSIDKFGAISVSGTGLASTFSLVVNQDNTEMRDRLGGLLFTGTASQTQALLNANGQVENSATFGAPLYAARAGAGSTQAWFNAAGLQSYGYNSTNAATEYGEPAGLRLSSSDNGDLFGVIELTLTNGLGVSTSRQFKCVPRNPDKGEYEFTTMGELSMLISSTLQEENFSSQVDALGVLKGDTGASCNIVDGRLVVATSAGGFDNLTIKAKNTVVNSGRSDAVNFEAVLGELALGVNGKKGVSNKMIEADQAVGSATGIYDSLGGFHNSRTLFIQDRSAGLDNVEWKYKVSLDANKNGFIDSEKDSEAYVKTFNTISDQTGARGVLGFDPDNNNLFGDGQGDVRYRSTGVLNFTTLGNSIESANSEIKLDFSKITSFRGRGGVFSQKIDGFPGGVLLDAKGETNTGYIVGIYSNGEERVIAKLGLTKVQNPEGLESVGSSCYRLTGNAQTVDGIFTIDAADEAKGMSRPKVQSNTLEASNVDILEELTTMLTDHRGYSANVKVITQNDELEQEAISLVR
jgi:flagellar hook-basal body protein